MMNRIALTAVMTLLAVPLLAQGRQPPPRAAALRGQIEESFMRRATLDLALTADQSDRMSKIVTAAGQRRRTLEEEQQASQMALMQQLRPGVAANTDSLNRLVDRITQNRISYAEAFRDEIRDLQPILSPVQRAQYLQLRDRLLERIRELQQNRQANGPPAGRP